jgi:protein-S-isoprenylcysteine O-methyltransferase Ste14
VIDGSRSVTQRLRVPLGFLFGAAFLAVAPKYATPERIAIGGLIAGFGVLIRAWATGFIVKNQTLTTTGPYAHTRNPLYLGSFLIGAGFALAAHWLALVAVLAFWFVVYRPTIAREQEFLRGVYGAAYVEYAAHVPALLPRLRAWPGPAGVDRSGKFSVRLYLRHNEWQAGLGFLGVLGWLLFSPWH